MRYYNSHKRLERERALTRYYKVKKWTADNQFIA